EALGGRELPVDRSELGLEFGHAGLEEAFDRFARFAENAAVDGEARPLDREHEIVRHLVAPFDEARRLLRAVIGAVDLDRGQLRARIFEFARLRQTFGKERASPGLEGPAADADPDLSRGL